MNKEIPSTYLDRKPRVGDTVEFRPNAGDSLLEEYGFVVGSKHKVLAYDSDDRCIKITNYTHVMSTGFVHHTYFKVLSPNNFKLKPTKLEN